MKISLNWLKDFVNLDGITPDEIVSRISMTTAEVEGYEVRGTDITGVVVGEVLTCTPHPSSKKPLSVLTVDGGQGVVPVVCGAPNVRAGMKIAFARVGAKLGDFKIGEAKLAGEPSHGMVCGGAELKINNDHDGIIDLADYLGMDHSDLVNGTPIEKIFPDMHDVIFEFDNKSLTNRPDLWGHYGFAREFAASFGRELKPYETYDLAKVDKKLPEPKIEIENWEDCYAFGSFKMENVMRKKTPARIAQRLFYCGVNSNGFLVDLSNYIMLEIGQPNHAFDSSKVGNLTIGNGREGDKFVTLKNQEIEVESDMIFVKSNGTLVSLAGIMGGANSLIDGDTTAVTFEFATFNPVTIRKTSQRVGIRTDSSARYEKSLDTSLVKIGAARMAGLVMKYDSSARFVSRFAFVGSTLTKSFDLNLKKSYLERFAGSKFDYAVVEKNLKALGFNPQMTKSDISVTVPTWRATKDINAPVDIIEEIVRIIGFDKIVPCAPKVELAPVAERLEYTREWLLRDLMVSKFNMTEVHTYIWYDDKILNDIGLERSSYIKIENSVGENSHIRDSHIPSLLTTLVKNKKQDRTRIFEIGNIQSECRGERKRLSFVLSSKTKRSEELYKEIASITRRVISELGGDATFEIGACKLTRFHPKNNAEIVVSDGAKKHTVGYLGIIHPSISEKIEKGLGITAVEIDMDLCNEVILPKRTTVEKISKFPKTKLDFTITTDKVYGELESAYSKFAHELSMGFRLKDIYERDGGVKSYTIEYTVGSAARNLSSEDIQSVWTAVVAHGKKVGFTVDE